MTYHIGDIPREDFVIEPAFALETGDTATSVVTDPEGEETSLTTTVELEDNEVVIQWPEESLFALGGVYELRVKVTSGERHERLPMISVIVQDDTTGWHTLDSIREIWAAAPDHDLALYELLEVSKNDCLAYAPALVEGAKAPINYKRGQYLHARNGFNAGAVDTNGEMGDNGFVIRPFPLDWTVKQTLRPKRAVPRVF